MILLLSLLLSFIDVRDHCKFLNMADMDIWLIWLCVAFSIKFVSHVTLIQFNGVIDILVKNSNDLTTSYFFYVN
jgi:hypothetical protein